MQLRLRLWFSAGPAWKIPLVAITLYLFPSCKETREKNTTSRYFCTTVRLDGEGPFAGTVVFPTGLLLCRPVQQRLRLSSSYVLGSRWLWWHCRRSRKKEESVTQKGGKKKKKTMRNLKSSPPPLLYILNFSSAKFSQHEVNALFFSLGK